jgi:hypothetical protein
MDHHEQHHQQHRKDREEHKKHEKEREQRAERDPASLHPAWYVVLFMVVGCVLMGGVLLVWMMY